MPAAAPAPPSVLPSELAEVVPLHREGLHHSVAARLRNLIIEGGLRPAEKLVERDLAERLGVSRTPLREAIKVLATEGLVELLPNRGAVVTSLSRDAVADTFELLAALEGLSGELAASRIDSDELATLRALHVGMRAAHAARDLSAYSVLNAQIHQTLNRAARNAVLTETYDRINARLQAFRFRSNFARDKWDVAMREHDLMLDALERRDAAEMRTLLVAHLHHKRDAVLILLDADAGARGAGASR